MTNELPAPIRTSRELSLEAEVSSLRAATAAAEARGYRKAIDRLRSDAAIEAATVREECACSHIKAQHHAVGRCMDGVTWTKGATCPCREYRLAQVSRDPGGLKRRAVEAAAEYLEATAATP